MLYGERRRTLRLLLVGFIKTDSPRIRVPLPRASHFYLFKGKSGEEILFSCMPSSFNWTQKIGTSLKFTWVVEDWLFYLHCWQPGHLYQLLGIGCKTK